MKEYLERWCHQIDIMLKCCSKHGATATANENKDGDGAYLVDVLEERRIGQMLFQTWAQNQTLCWSNAPPNT